ncbi:MAG: segregation/condensation protein A [Patescibacteria group bacterium]
MSTATNLNFSIKTEVFEGPLELLLELVERRKFLINDISLASVTDEYMQYVSDMQEESLPNTSRFVALAATLLLLKSKSLLPVLELTQDEEESIDNLEERLRLYQIYRDAAKNLMNQFGQTMLYEPLFAPPKEPLFLPDSLCTVEVLHAAIGEVVVQLPKTEEKPKARVRPTISLEEMIDKLQHRIEQQMKTRFSELKQEVTEHKEVIVGFLAILELVKQGNVLVKQISRFDDIEIEVEQTGVPNYH